MPNIIFLPDNREEAAGQNETILAVAKRAGIPLPHVCQGTGRCSTCRVQIIEGIEHVSPRSRIERCVADQLAFGKEIRLACQTRFRGNIKVRRLVLDDKDIELTSLFIRGSGSNVVGVEKHVLILFADIRGFTSLSENLLPYDVVHMLNRYFHSMDECITRHGGRIDNYMGDGFMALFDITATEKDVLRGVMAGLEMLDLVNRLIRPYVQELFHKDFRIGIGLHYGLVVAGTIGGGNSRRNTIIGDAVNFASRIEKSNKQLGSQFLISEDIYNFVHKSIRVNRKLAVEISGKSGVHTLYEVIGLR